MIEEVPMISESRQVEKGFMKAIVRDRYGSPDVLQLKEVEKPAPNDVRGVLVKIYASSVNPADRYDVRGPPFLIRLVLPMFRMGMGLRRPKEAGVGSDIAGRVEAVSNNVTQFKPGDEVYGVCNAGYAEYGTARESKIALKPANRSFEESAAVPIAGLTALQALRNHGHIKPGQKVLVNGAGGGVGTFAVQIAKSFETEVTAVTNTKNLDMVRSIGADHVIDYTQEDFTKNGQRYDLIFDAVGNRSVSDYKRALSPNGICAVAGFTTLPHLFQVLVLGSWVSMTGSKKIGLMETANPNKKDLLFIKELLEAGKVVPVIDRRYPLREVPEAIRYLEEGHAKGKVVITVQQNNHT